MTRAVTAVPESAIRLRVNGLVVETWTCSPVALEALAAGRLRAGGFIREAADLRSLEVPAPPGPVLAVDAQVAPERAAAGIEERDHRAAHQCGPRFVLDCRPDLIARDRPGAAPDPAVFPELFRELYDRAGSYRATGGLHTSALSDGHGLRYLHEEVGRHNAADKAIGAALLDGADPARFGLVTTARVSGEIAAKAARAGLAWIASRSVPTTLAVEIARAAGIVIVARAAGKDARLFPAGGA